MLLQGEKKRQVFFCLTRNKTRSLWQGPSLGPEEAKGALDVDETYAMEYLPEYLKSSLPGVRTFYLSLTNENRGLDLIRKMKRRGKQYPTHLIDSDELIGDMRIIKDAAEITLIREAARISVEAHNCVAAKLPQLGYEYQAEAELMHCYRSQAAYSAFPPIVAAGTNACTLHYMKNDCPIKLHDWVLVDSGAQYKYYAADLTRTYSPRQPHNSSFDKIHQAVTRALNQVHKTAKLGLPFARLHEVSCRALTEELIKLHIIKDGLRQALQKELYKPYFPHLTSHWIGLDVHDAGSYSNQRLKAGMVFSVEPGLYFASDDQAVAPRWRGIGVRLEDTVLMTRNGAQNLTAAACHNMLL